MPNATPLLGDVACQVGELTLADAADDGARAACGVEGQVTGDKHAAADDGAACGGECRVTGVISMQALRSVAVAYASGTQMIRGRVHELAVAFLHSRPWRI